MVLPKHTINPLSIFTSGYWNNQRSRSVISPWKQLKFNDIRNKLKSLPQLSSGEKLNKTTQSVYTFLKANRDNLKYSSQETYGGLTKRVKALGIQGLQLINCTPITKNFILLVTSVVLLCRFLRILALGMTCILRPTLPTNIH